jgi:hypothetical protein
LGSHFKIETGPKKAAFDRGFLFPTVKTNPLLITPAKCRRTSDLEKSTNSSDEV